MLELNDEEVVVEVGNDDDDLMMIIWCRSDAQLTISQYFFLLMMVWRFD